MAVSRATVVLIRGQRIEVTVEKHFEGSAPGYRVTKVLNLDTLDEIDVETALRNDLVYRSAVNLVEQMRLEDLIPNVNLRELS